MDSSSVKMYKRGNDIGLPSSASLRTVNLSILHLNGKTYVGIIHKGEFVIVNITDQDEVINKVIPKLSPQQIVLQGTWIWEENPILIILTTSAAQIFDWDGAILLHTHHENSPLYDSGATFLKGVVGLPSGRICIGVHTGMILLLNLKDSNNLAFVEEESMKFFPHPVMAMSSKNKMMAAADAKGTIIIAEDDDTLKKCLEIKPYGNESCITCLELFDNVVIAGYFSGKIRIFNTTNGQIRAEICAHTKFISSLHIAKMSGALLSVSEDTFIRIWKLDLSSPILIEHKFSENVINAALVGGRFINENGTEFLVSVYDLPALILYAM